MECLQRWMFLLSLVMCVCFAVGQFGDQLECSATPQDDMTPFRVGQYIILDCHWMVEVGPPSNLLSNASLDGTTDAPTTQRGGSTAGLEERPQLAWYRREASGNLSELSASHEMTVKWRLAGDDFGIEFLCAATNGSEVLYSSTCSLTPLAIIPEVDIVSSPGEHHVGKSNTFKCDGQPESEIVTYQWFVNGMEKFADHDARFDGDRHILVDGVIEHRHGYLTFDKLNMTDNGTLITCVAWTTANVTRNASLVLIITESNDAGAHWTKESVLLLACLAAGGAPVLFLIIVCIIWCIRRAVKRRRRGYEIDYSGSFKSEEDRAVATEDNTNDVPLQRRFQANTAGSNSNHRAGAGTTAAGLQRPSFFREKLNRFSQLFFTTTPTRYIDDESIYENTQPSLSTFSDHSLSRGGSASKGGSITRSGSLQLPHRPPLTKSASTVSTPMSAPLCSASSLSRNRHVDADEQEYQNFVPPIMESYENTPSVLSSPTTPTW